VILLFIEIRVQNLFDKWIKFSKKMWNASRFCVSSLRRGHANLLCIVPILVYVLPKQEQEFWLSISIYTTHTTMLISWSISFNPLYPWRLCFVSYCLVLLLPRNGFFFCDFERFMNLKANISIHFHSLTRIKKSNLSNV
jgi:hypothetical protein